MSTRRLIVAALLCGLAILIAGTIMLIRLDSGPGSDELPNEPRPFTSLRQP